MRESEGMVRTSTCRLTLTFMTRERASPGRQDFRHRISLVILGGFQRPNTSGRDTHSLIVRANT